MKNKISMLLICFIALSCSNNINPPSEKDITKCVPIQLPKALRPDLGLKNKADILGKKIKLKGDAATYFNVVGMIL